MGSFNRSLFSSNSDEWATPQYLFDGLDAEFHFTLDPCATDENHKCKNYFTKTDDGISKNWGAISSSVIHHTAERLASGLRNLMKKDRSHKQ